MTCTYSGCTVFQLSNRKLAIASVAVILIALFAAFQVVVVPTPSMERTVMVGDHLLINRLAFLWKGVRRGDVVSFRAPNRHNTVYLKRVIAVGGDRVEFREDAVFVNGAPLSESYVEHVCRACGERGHTLIVPNGQLYVMGDNRDKSEDSRYFGTVPASSVVGAPVMVLWSFSYPTEVWQRSSTLAVYLDHPLSRLRWSRFLQLVQ